ncbi:MAG TPA: hypothetical protein VLG38_06795, partial [Gammaproteobacteria bacterium]|nr:hypothetical protein [Gammaproteobacteria bacterium]
MPSLVLYENPNDPAVPMVMVLNDMVLSDNSDFSPPPTGFSYEYIPAYKLSARDPDMFFVLETGPGPYFEQRVLRTKNPYGFDSVVKNSQVEQANRLTKKNNEVISIDNVDAPFVTQLELVFDFYPAHSAFKVTVLYITDQDQLQLANDTWNKVAVMKTNIAMLHEHMLQQRIYAEATLIANQIVSINMANFYAFLEQQQAATNNQPKNTTLHARQAPSKHLKSKTVTQPPPSWNNPPKRRSSYKVTGSTPIETANLVVKPIFKRGNLPTPTVAPAAPIMLSSNAIQIQNSASSAQLDAANLEKAFTINLINALLASLEPTAQDTPLNERALNALLENIIAIYNSNPSANKDKHALQNICRLLAMHILPVDICLLGSKSLQELTKAGKIDQNISGMLLNALLAQVATQLDVLKESSNEDKAALLSILDVGGLGDYIFAECYDNYLPIVNELFATLLPKQQPEQTIMSTQDVEPPAALSTRPTPIRKKTHIVKKSKEIPLEQALRELGIKAKAATTAEIYQQAVQNIDSKNPDSALTKLQSIEKAITRDETLVLLQYVIEKALDVKDTKKLLQFLTEKAGNKLLTKDKHGDNIFDLCIKHYFKYSTANHENVAAILEILDPQVTQHIALRNDKNEVDLRDAIYFFKNATGSNFLIDLFEKLWDQPT